MPYSSSNKPNKKPRHRVTTGKSDGTSGKDDIRLNKFLANAGIASRREADKLIESGTVTVNGKPVTELGARVKPTDDVRFEGQRIRRERKVYVLLNKPKDTITTMDDPKGRKTVMDLVANACAERIYPVGRLDRMTTGLLLLTNDGELAKRLIHPSHGVRKTYHSVLNRPLSAEDKRAIEAGLTLEDGPVAVDEISYVEGQPKTEVGLTLHVGKNRIVRRIFDHLNYRVVKLDRVLFGPLNKKRLKRGHFRELTGQEVINLRNAVSSHNQPKMESVKIRRERVSPVADDGEGKKRSGGARPSGSRSNSPRATGGSKSRAASSRSSSRTASSRTASSRPESSSRSTGDSRPFKSTRSSGSARATSSGRSGAGSNPRKSSKPRSSKK